MRIEQLEIEGAYLVTPRVHSDERGSFFEWFKAPAFEESVGHPLTLAQANCSVSSQGTVRGIHYCDVPPGQAKYVACLSGAVLDVIVDVRVGSPTFGASSSVVLAAAEPRLVYLSEGLGHGFVAREPTSVVVYLCSTTYNPTAEREVNPFDPELGIDWGVAREQALLSAKDAAAPSLEAARSQGLLPDYTVCREYL
jgi:dTDP-4-dehydrorhamnose 3,5-epimerase